MVNPQKPSASNDDFMHMKLQIDSSSPFFRVFWSKAAPGCWATGLLERKSTKMKRQLKNDARGTTHIFSSQFLPHDDFLNRRLFGAFQEILLNGFLESSLIFLIILFPYFILIIPYKSFKLEGFFYFYMDLQIGQQDGPRN
ncbi:hypothetical protein B9Z55_008882 [Caenorhabditis nigoni]|uniref:Uncharacterized protein n=1 Tax=Caenorhabditis nigoni TaxID=1611254 RepID=A0A2G5UPJ9_9PELO|nr:hypothetical protein B9Z55_008882 [Caenorhabditis nigoni]